MTNPNNAVGTNGAFNGRTSVNAFNDDLAAYSKGIISGWECAPSSGLTVVLGGDGETRDVAVAEDNIGNKTTINNISGSPIPVTISTAPASDSRIDAIVAYVDNPPTGVETVADNPSACGIISVVGTVASSPTEPDENAIRAAITADGASGLTAYYVVLAQVKVASGTTDITSTDIIKGGLSKLNAFLSATGWQEPTSGTSYYRQDNWVTVYDYFKAGTPAQGTTNGTYTSPAGNTYEFITLNYRTGGAVTSGADNIYRARGGIYYQPTNSRNIKIAVRGVSAGSSAYFDILGGYEQASSAAVSPSRITVTASGTNPYTSGAVIGSSSNHNCMTITYELMRGFCISPNQYWWHFRGTIYGQRISVSFTVSASATNAGTIPGLYITDVSGNLPIGVGTWFEINEPINY